MVTQRSRIIENATEKTVDSKGNMYVSEGVHLKEDKKTGLIYPVQSPIVKIKDGDVLPAHLM